MSTKPNGEYRETSTVDAAALPAFTAGSGRSKRFRQILRAAMFMALALSGQWFRVGAQTETNLYVFGNQPDGANPRSGVIQGVDSNFYGTTYVGGTNNRGCVYRVTPGGSETNLYSFGSQSLGLDGANPSAPLIDGGDGYFYGTAINGGSNGVGVVFRITPSGNFSNLYSFQGMTNDGANPTAGLVKGGDGYFYGTTQKGGAGDFGSIFRFNPTNSAETMIYSFAGSPTDGFQPLSGMILGSDGNFYGTTFFGGSTNTNNNGYGIVFRISTNGSYTNLYSFGTNLLGGIFPGALVEGNDGNYYGNLLTGGAYTNRGAVFRITPSGSESLFYSFGGIPNDGSNADSGLMLAPDGNFYGTTARGGTNDLGTVFRLSPSGSETILYTFGSQTNDGANPLDGVILANNGNFYGTTQEGGVSNKGVVFKLTSPFIPTNRITSITINSGTNIVITIDAATNKAYQLQFSPSLSPTDWSNVTGASFTSSNGGLVSLTNSVHALGREGFYRFSIGP